MRAMAQPLRVLVASEDDDTYRLLRFILQQEPDVAIVGLAQSGSEMQALIQDLAPQVVLLDLEAAGHGISASLPNAKRRGPDVHFAALSNDPRAAAVVSGDLDAIMLKNGPLDDLAEVLRGVYDSPSRQIDGRADDRVDHAADPVLTMFLDNLQRRNEELEESLNLVHFWLQERETGQRSGSSPAPVDLDSMVAPQGQHGYTLSVDGFFNAQHQVTIGGAEGQLHPHSWRVTARVRQDSLGSDHMFLGFADAKRILRQVLAALDGKTLNDLPQFANTQPTTEHISATLFANLGPEVERNGGCLESVTVWESPTNSVTSGER